MGLRFRRSIKLAPGVRVNVSKSGPSVSVGGRGATLNSSGRGTTSTLGIPGTGVSVRSPARSSRQTSPTGRMTGLTAKELREREFQANSARIEQEEAEYQHRLDSWRKMPPIVSRDEWSAVLIARAFTPSPPPTAPDSDSARASYAERVKKEAKARTAPGVARGTLEFLVRLFCAAVGVFLAREFLILFPQSTYSGWLASLARLGLFVGGAVVPYVLAERFLSRKRRALVAEDVESKLNTEWPDERQRLSEEFDKILERFSQSERRAQEEWNNLEKQRISRVQALLDGDVAIVTEELEQRFSQTDLPYELSTTVSVPEATSCYVNLDLPEIEDFVAETSTKALKSGKVTERKRKQSDMFADYASVAVGLGFYVTGNAFAVAPSIAAVHVAAYTQRISKRTGNIEDQYVYAVKIERDHFCELNFQRLDPVAALEEFDHVVSRKATGYLGTIDVPDWRDF